MARNWQAVRAEMVERGLDESRVAEVIASLRRGIEQAAAGETRRRDDLLDAD